MSLYKAPVKVLEKIESIMKGFLWAGASEGRKMHWVAWEVVTTPKKMGGLGIAKLGDVNTALLTKWAWRFKKEEGSLWRRVVELVHGGRNRWELLPITRSFSGCWKSIVVFLEKLKINGKRINDFLKAVVGRGNKVRFWLDLWFGNVKLKHRWPNLFDRDRCKGCSVNERIQKVGEDLVFNADWRLDPDTVETI